MNLARAVRPTRLRLIIVTVALAVAGLLAATTQAVSARTGAQHVSRWDGGTKPVIVLEHGAWAHSSSWDGVIQRLQLLGYTVDVPPNPRRSLPGDSAYLADFLSSISGPVILVGHSYGGEVITNAATGNSQVKALVYDDAYLPARGEDLKSLTTAGSCFYVQDLSSVFTFVPFPGAPTGVADAYVKPSVFPGCFANGLPASEAAVLAATQRPLASGTFTDQSRAPAWKTIPSWDVIGLNDHIVTPAEQLFMAKRAGARITEINAPHLSMISNPGVIASVIIQAAQATS